MTICDRHRVAVREIAMLRAVWRELNGAVRSARDGREVDGISTRLSEMEARLFEEARLTYHESTGAILARYSHCPACIQAGTRSIEEALR